MRHLEAIGRAAAAGSALRTVRYVNDLVLDYLWEMANGDTNVEDKAARNAARVLFDHAEGGAQT